jgi:hypothetical protein
VVAVLDRPPDERVEAPGETARGASPARVRSVRQRARHDQRERSVHDALDALATHQAHTRLAGQRQLSTTPMGPGVGALVVVLIAVVAIVGAAAWAARPAPRPCEPIRFVLEGSPPSYVGSELIAATREISRRSGLVFEASDAASATLRIRWTHHLSAASSVPLSDGATRHLAFGGGAWAYEGGRRTLATALIEVDSSPSWTHGLDRHDSLAAVFAHELGHVVGLAHSQDEASFMHPLARSGTPEWTAEDRAGLERAGHEAGCRT